MSRGRPQKERTTKLGKYLTECRKLAELTLSKAAKEAGIDTGYLSRLETSGKTPPPSVIRGLARTYDVDGDSPPLSNLVLHTRLHTRLHSTGVLTLFSACSQEFSL